MAFAELQTPPMMSEQAPVPVMAPVQGMQAAPAEWETQNLAVDLDETKAKEIADLCIREFEADDEDRAEWLDMHARWMRLYHQQDKPVDPEYDWASEESLPILAEACNQFASRAYKAFFPNRSIIKAVPTGKASAADWQRADRVSKHMSWQLLVRDRSYKRNKRRMLLSVAVHGSHFTKTYYDPITEKNEIVNVRAEDLVVPYGTGPRDIEDVERKTHVIFMTTGKAKRLMDAGFFSEQAEKWERTDEKETTEASQNAEGLHPSDMDRNPGREARILEQHRWLDLGEGDMPHIVWVDTQSRKVLRIVRRFGPDGKAVEYFTHYPFIENPDGFYGLGMGHLVGEINKSCNKLLRQMLDSATLANVGNHSGFISQSVAPGGGNVNLELGQLTKLPGSVDDLNRGIKTLSFPGPNQAMAEILSLIMARSDRLASVTEMVTGAAEKIMQPTAVLALIEQAMEQYSSIYEGLFDAWGEELQKVYELNSKYLNVPEYFTVNDASTPEVMQAAPLDYALDLQIVPLADPKMATEQQRLTRAEVEHNFVVNYLATQAQLAAMPAVLPYLYASALTYAGAIGMDDIETKIAPPPPPPEPVRLDDPRQENVMALMPNQPQMPEVFLDQNHLEHLKAHEEVMNDPAYMDRFAPGGKEALTAHIQKHIALLYGLTEADIGAALESGGGGGDGMGGAPGNGMAPTGPVAPMPM